MIAPVDTHQTANAFFNNNSNKNSNSNSNSNNNSTLLKPTSTPTPTPTPSPTPSPSSNAHSTLSPILIAAIIIIPILAAILSILYCRKSIFNRSNITHPHQINLRSSPTQTPSPAHLILPPGGTGADRPIGHRRTDRFRRMIGIIHRRTSRSESIRTVPEYSVDPQGTEISLAHAQRSAPESTVITRFITPDHLANPTTTQHTIPQAHPTTSLFSPELIPPPNHDHYTQDPPPDYNISTRPHHHPRSTIPIDSSQLIIPPPNISMNPTSSHHHHQNLQIHRTLTSSSQASSFASPPNTKPTDPSTTNLLIDTEFNGLFSSSSAVSTPSVLPTPMTNTHTTSSTTPNNPNLTHHVQAHNPTHDPSFSTTSTSNNQHVYYRIPSGAPTPQQLSFLTRIGNLSRLGLPRPDPHLVNHLTVAVQDPNAPPPPPPFDPLSS